MLEELYISSGLGTPWDAPGGSGKCCWILVSLLTAQPDFGRTDGWITAYSINTFAGMMLCISRYSKPS